MNKEPPKIAQFTAIRGKNIPSELYNAGENFSITISTNCTIEAITAINMIKDRKDKSTFINSLEIHTNAPSFKT